MTSLAHKPANDTRLDDLMKEVRELGRDAAAGNDSLPKLAMRVVQAAADGVLSTDKDSDGVDDASKVYEEYVKSESKKAIHEHTGGGKKANVSKLRQLITMGVMTTCDPVDVLERTHKLRDELIKADQKCKPAYASYVDVAREQLKHDSDVTDDMIRGAVLKPEPAEKTVEDILGGVVKKLEKLILGEDGPKDQSEQVIGACDMIKERLAALLKKSDEDKFRAAAQEKGMDISGFSPEMIQHAIAAVRAAA